MFRTSLVILGLVAVFLGTSAFAEEGEELGFREKMTVRMLKDRLDLTDEQVSKLEGVLKSSKKETEVKIKDFLTDDQKGEYEKILKDSGRGVMGMGGFGGRGGRGGRGGERGGPGGMGGFRFGGPGGMGGMGGQMTQILGQMKERLKLTEGQSEKVEAILSEVGEEATAKFMEKLPEYMENGRPDWRKMMGEMSKEMEKYIGKAEKRIKKELKEEQIPEFEKMMGEFREQISRMGSMGGDRRGRRDRGNRIDRIMADLSGSPEEKAIIREKVEAILEVQNKWSEKIRSGRRELGEMLKKDEGSSDDIQSKLGSVRELEKAFESEIAPLREDLVPILSFEQEAQLVVHRILE